MALTDFQIFTKWVYKTMVENIAQNIDLFNANTRGGLVLTAAQNTGDYSDAASYAFLTGLVRRRDAYGDGSVSEIALKMLLDTSVKVDAGTPPVRIDPGWFKRIQKDPAEAGIILGMQLAQQSLADRVNTAIKALVAATANISGAALTYDGTDAVASLGALVNGASKFGDRSNQIVCWLIHSKPMFDIFGANLANTNRIFNFGTVSIVQDGFGRPFVITDAPDLVYTSSGTKYRTLGVVPGAAIVEDNGDFTDNIQNINGNESIRRTYQAEWSFNVGVKGFAWDKANGGKSPNNAALGTGSNWDQYATSNKDLAAVLVNSL